MCFLILISRSPTQSIFTMCLRLLFFCVCIYVKEHSNLFCSNLYIILCEKYTKEITDCI